MVSFNTLLALTVLAAGVQSQQAGVATQSSLSVPSACSAVCQPLVDIASACSSSANTRTSSQRAGFFGPRQARRTASPDHGKRDHSNRDHGKRSQHLPDHGRRSASLSDHGKRATRLPDHGKRLMQDDDSETAEQIPKASSPGFFGPRKARAAAIEKRFESASSACGPCVEQNGADLNGKLITRSE